MKFKIKNKDRKKDKIEKRDNLYNATLSDSESLSQNQMAGQTEELQKVVQRAVMSQTQEDDMKTVRLEEPEYTLELGLSSNIGRREYQQDVALASYENKDGDTRAIAILCDGMGGMNNGEIASNVCVNQIFDHFTENSEISDFNAFLVDEACKADEYVSSLTDKDGESLNAGCTLVALIIEHKKMHWVSVGDSRVYILRNNEMVQITTDHNYMMILNEKVKNGELQYEEAMADKSREALISYIGMCGLKIIDANVKPFELKSDDFILVCSDGLYRTLNNDQIKSIIQKNYNNVSLAVQELVETAVCNGPSTQDNTSAILIKCI